MYPLFYTNRNKNSTLYSNLFHFQTISTFFQTLKPLLKQPSEHQLPLHFQGIILIALTAMLDPLRPQPCQNGSGMCPTPSKVQFSVLYSGLALAAIGVAGTRFTIAAMGANQFDHSKNQRTFFNWFAVTLYTSMVFGSTVLVYIEENVNWALGYCLCIAVNVIGLVIFLLGRRYYRHVKPQGSPFTSLAHVVTATILKRKVPLSSTAEHYYHQKDGQTDQKQASMPSKGFGYDLYILYILKIPELKITRKVTLVLYMSNAGF